MTEQLRLSSCIRAYFSAAHPIQNAETLLNAMEQRDYSCLPVQAPHLGSVWAHHMSEWVHDPDSLMGF